MSFRLKFIFTALFVFVSAAVIGNRAIAQDALPQVHEWRLVKKQIVEKKVVEVPQTISETQLEKVKNLRSRQVWDTVTRHRQVVTKKPVQETRYRLERRTVLKPVEVTKYRDRVIREKEYRNVTRYRDETYTVQKPVVETELREERVTVKRPVTENLVEVKRTTTYKPITEKRTEYVQKPGTFNYAVQPDPNQRPRLRYLSPGYYTDPSTGMTVYRRRGLHWSAPNAVVPVVATPPSIVPTEKMETRYIPETTESRRPIEVTRMVERTETKRVPVQVERMVEETKTRKVPYTIQEPIIRERTERVPYTDTEYREQVIEKEVPYIETVVKEEVHLEPYQVEVGKWIDEEVIEEVPRRVTRTVMKQVVKEVPRTVWMKAPFDINGRQVGPAVPLSDDDAGSLRIDAADRAPSLNSSVGEGTTLGQTPQERTSAKKVDLEEGGTSVLEPTGRIINSAMKPIVGEGGSGNQPEESDGSAEGTGEPVVPAAIAPTMSQDSGDDSATGNEAAADGVSKK